MPEAFSRGFRYPVFEVNARKEGSRPDWHSFRVNSKFLYEPHNQFRQTGKLSTRADLPVQSERAVQRPACSKWSLFVYCDKPMKNLANTLFDQ